MGRKFTVLVCGALCMAIFACCCAIAAEVPQAGAGPHDWPQFGGTIARNMVSAETDLPDSFEIGDDQHPAKNVRWVAQLTGNYVGADNVAIANGRIYISLKSAMALSMDKIRNYLPFSCLDEKTGKLLWQVNSQQNSHTTTTKSTTSGFTTPTVEGDRIYCYRRNLLMCLTTSGYTGDNHGPFKDEYKEYGLASSDELTEKDADIVWMYNLYDELGVKFDHSVAYAPVVYGRYVYASSGNAGGARPPSDDDSRKMLDTSRKPAFIALDKVTGKLAAAEDEHISERTIRGQWGTPSVAMVNGKPQVLFGGGDGTIYAFEPLGDVPPADGKLKKIWSFDVNCHWTSWKTNLRPGGEPFDATKLKDYAYNHFLAYGRNQKLRKGPQEYLLGAPVCVGNRVYCALGGDWGSGPESAAYWPCGRLVCIDATKTGDLTETGLIWENGEIGPSEATVSVADGLLYISDVYGKVYCIDAQTGKTVWSFDSGKPIYSSTLVADGKVYFGNSRAEFFILKAGRELKVLYQTKLKGYMSGPLAVANKTLYLVAGDRMYAIQKSDPSGAPPSPPKE